MTVCADGRTWRTSARRSAVRCRYAISPAWPRASHSRKKRSSGWSAAGAMPHASNPSSRARVLISADVIAHGDPERSTATLKGSPYRRRAGLSLQRRATLSGSPSMLSDQLSEHVRQDSTMLEGDQFFRRVDARDRLELDRRVAAAERADGDEAAGPQALRDAGQLVALAAGQPERRRRAAWLVLQRQHAHVDEVAAVNALEALGEHRLDAEQQRAFRGPVA